MEAIDINAMEEGASVFNPPVFRYTVRTPEARRAAIKKAARRVGMTDGQLVQALFDCLDLSSADGVVTIAKEHFDKLFPRGETTRELNERARSVGLTARELKVFRALAASAGITRIVRPDPFDITARSGVAANHLDTTYDGLLEKGFIGISPGAGRGRRTFTICRMPEI